MKRLGVFAMAAALALSSVPAAQARQPVPAFTPAANSTFLVDLDTPAEHLALWEANDLTGLNALRAKLTIRALAKGNSGFGIEVGNDTGDVTFMMAGKKNMVGAMGIVHEGDKSKDDQDAPFAAYFQVGETVDLSIDWTPDGKVTIVLRDKTSSTIGQGFERHVLDLPGGAPTRIRVMAMGGEIELKPLQLGRSGG